MTFQQQLSAASSLDSVETIKSTTDDSEIEFWYSSMQIDALSEESLDKITKLIVGGE